MPISAPLVAESGLSSIREGNDIQIRAGSGIDELERWEALKGDEAGVVRLISGTAAS